MQLDGISKIEDYQFYLDKAIRSSKKRMGILKGKLKRARNRDAIMRKEWVKLITASVVKDLEGLEKAFPTLDNLPLFYQELIDVTLGKTKLKKAIAGISWLKNKSEKLEKDYIARMARDTGSADKVKKAFLGRLSSMFKKVKKDFVFLDNARKELRGFPSLKTSMKTVCIAGYPNVGKSTLLNRLTGASSEINVYPFTTKGLKLGYIGKKVQLIDTPGAFRQDLRKMNIIEKQAFLALKHLCSTVVFVIDPTETSGYSIKDQEDMLDFITRKFNKHTLLYISKTDILKERNKVEELRKKHSGTEVFESFEALRKRLKRR